MLILVRGTVPLRFEQVQYKVFVFLCFVVNKNNVFALKSFDGLREHIASIALNEPYMGEKIPIRWLQFEGSLAEMAARERHYISLTQVSCCFHDEFIFGPKLTYLCKHSACVTKN